MQSDNEEAPFKMCEGKTYFRFGGNFIEFGDFTLKLIAEVCGGSESYWLGSCETEVHRFLQTRQVLLPTSVFDSKGKFLTCLREQYSAGTGAGSFSLGSRVGQKEVSDYFKFLREDYQLGDSRLCKIVSHIGHQFGNQWFLNEQVQLKNGNQVPEDELSFFCTDPQLKDFSLEISEDILTSSDQLKFVLNRYIELAHKAFGENSNAFISATAFVGWRLMSNAMQDQNGEANIGLIYSPMKSVGKTTALQILAYGQGCSSKGHPLLMSLGNQCTSGTSLKMIMDRISRSTMVAFLDDGKMTPDLAEFLLQLQGGLSQGSTNVGTFVPKGSVLLTSNYQETDRLTGRVLTFPFTAAGGYCKEVEDYITALTKLVCNNRGIITLWAIKSLPTYECISDEVVPQVANALAKVYRNYQARWHKGVAGVIASHALLLKFAGYKETLVDIFKRYLDSTDADDTIKKVQLAMYYEIEANPVPSKVLSWLNPSVKINTGNNKYVYGIALANTTINQWSDVTRGELNIEASKHGESCLNQSHAFACSDNCKLAGELKRESEGVKMKKSTKIPKSVLCPKLVTFIECMTGMDDEADIEGIRSTVLEEIMEGTEKETGPAKEIFQGLETLQIAFDKIIEDKDKDCQTPSTSMEFPKMMETLEAMTPRTKRQAEMYTPIRRKVFLQGYVKGMSRRLLSNEVDDIESTGQARGIMETPSVSGAVGVLASARKALDLNNVEDHGSEDEDNETCTMCGMLIPPGNRKNITWIQCNGCDDWYHLSCAGLRRKPPTEDDWFCSFCNNSRK